MPVDLDQVGIDLMDRTIRPMLEDLQGNIFKPHGRKHSAYLVVTFLRDQSEEIRDWIRKFATFHVTTAADQIKDALRYRLLKVDAGLFGNFFLSARGYEVLGYTDLNQIPSDHGNTFARGMKDGGINAALKDPSPDTWEEGYQSEIHALLFLADNDPDSLERAVNDFTSELQPLTEQLTVEYGVRWFGPDGKQDIEPFGFADGISQPLFLKKDIEKAQQGGIDKWDPSAPLNLVLVKDPLGGEDSYGSFFVFRKLEQNVAGFQRRVAELAEALKTNPKLAGAYVVGRFQDGTPVELYDHEVGAETQDYDTNFDYADDMKGSRCPFQAHIRKTNPRGDTVRVFEGDYKFERNHRIVRRGVPFGKQPPRGAKPAWPVGLLFGCYQSDIGNQFELIQRTWCNALHFVLQKTGLDPISGQGEQLIGGQQGWPSEYGNDSKDGNDSKAKDVKFDFPPYDPDFKTYVTLKGGEYFFAPSLSFLTKLPDPSNP